MSADPILENRSFLGSSRSCNPRKPNTVSAMARRFGYYLQTGQNRVKSGIASSFGMEGDHCILPSNLLKAQIVPLLGLTAQQALLPKSLKHVGARRLLEDDWVKSGRDEEEAAPVD